MRMPFSLMVTVMNLMSCSAICRRAASIINSVSCAGTPVATESSFKLGQTIVAPEYLLKSFDFGSTSTGTPAARAARITASHTSSVSTPFA